MCYHQTAVTETRLRKLAFIPLSNWIIFVIVAFRRNKRALSDTKRCEISSKQNKKIAGVKCMKSHFIMNLEMRQFPEKWLLTQTQFSYNKTAISQRNVNEFSAKTSQFWSEIWWLNLKRFHDNTGYIWVKTRSSLEHAWVYCENPTYVGGGICNFCIFSMCK